jgi:hypothetical protein
MPVSETLDIKPGSELSQRILDMVKDRVMFSKRSTQTKHDQWAKGEESVLAYLPERTVDERRRLQREAGKPQYTTVVVPYTYGVLMASHTYWTTVFMSRNPILQFTGRHGESQQKIQALEAIIDYQVQVGEMLVPWYIWLYDAGKYGVGILGMYWDEVETRVSRIETIEQSILGFNTGRSKKRKITETIKGYMGNKVYNIRPYDFFPDPRVPFARFQEGEFCAIYNELGWSRVLDLQAKGEFTNVDRLKKDQSGDTGGRDQGSSILELPESGNFGWSDFSNRKAQDVVKVYEHYQDLIPSQWGLGKSDRSEKWVFTVTTDWKYVLSARPLGYYHNRFPLMVIEYEPEGYALVNRGIPEVIKPIQNTLDWLLNSHFYNVRKALNDQFIVDPSRVMMKDVLDPLPGGIIRLKAEAYGTDVRGAIEQLQVTDVTQAHLRDMNVMFEIGQRALGVNDQIMGMIQKGGRKTATEIRTSSSFGINRLKTTAEYFSAMGWSPMGSMLVQNTQQLYDAEMQFKLVGDLMQEAGPGFVQVTPDEIGGMYNFVPVDGTLPVDRFAQANMWRELFVAMRNMPEIAQQYDTGRIFAWVAQLAGLKNISQFKLQTNVLPDEEVQREAQKGNLVPISGGRPQDLDRPSPVAAGAAGNSA